MEIIRRATSISDLDELIDIFGMSVIVIYSTELSKKSKLNMMRKYLPEHFENGKPIFFLNHMNHWILLMKIGGDIEFFDSFGRPLNELDKNLSILIFDVLGYKNYIFSRYELQNKKSSVCGWWCVFRLLNNDLTLYNFIKKCVMISEKNNIDYDILPVMLVKEFIPT